MVEKKQILQKIQEKTQKSIGGIFMALKETIQEFKEFAIKGNVVDMAEGYRRSEKNFTVHFGQLFWIQQS